MKRTIVVAAIAALGGCATGNIAMTPVQLPDGSRGYVYTGDMDPYFLSHRGLADKKMAEFCATKGLVPVVVQAQNDRIGSVGSGYGTGLGTAGVFAMGSSTDVREENKVFKCVKEDADYAAGPRPAPTAPPASERR